MSIPQAKAHLLAKIEQYRLGYVESHEVDECLRNYRQAVERAAGGDDQESAVVVDLRAKVRDLEHRVRAIRADRDALARARDVAVRQLDERATIDRLRDVIAELQGGGR